MRIGALHAQDLPVAASQTADRDPLLGRFAVVHRTELYAARAVCRALRNCPDDLEGGSPSPELERLRRVRRQREELGYAREIGEIEGSAILWAQVAEAMVHIRKFAQDQIQDHGGNGTADRWDETLTEVERITDRYAPPGARRRTLRVEMEDGTVLEIPLPLHGTEKKV